MPPRCRLPVPRLAIALAAVLLPSLAARAGRAHGLSPVLLEIAARADGTASVSWKTAPSVPRGANLAPVLPAACKPLGEAVLGNTPEGVTRTQEFDCGAAGLVGGSISVSDLDVARTDALLRISLPDSREIRTVLRGDGPPFVVPRRASAAEAFGEGLRGGLRHLSARADALLFVAGLVLLARDARSLAAAVAAFLLANGLALVATALGAIAPRPALAGFLAAASVLAIAAEVARDETATAARLRPWIPGAVLGAVHGLALAPDPLAAAAGDATGPIALVGWHLGVEVVLALAAAALGAAWLAVGSAFGRDLEPASSASLARALSWPIGCAAAFLAIERAARLLG